MRSSLVGVVAVLGLAVGCTGSSSDASEGAMSTTVTTEAVPTTAPPVTVDSSVVPEIDEEFTGSFDAFVNLEGLISEGAPPTVSVGLLGFEDFSLISQAWFVGSDGAVFPISVDVDSELLRSIVGSSPFDSMSRAGDEYVVDVVFVVESETGELTTFSITGAVFETVS